MDSSFEDEDNGNGVFEDIHDDISILQYSKQFENEENSENAMEELLPEQNHLIIKEALELKLKKLEIKKNRLKHIRKTKLETIQNYDECKNEQKEQLDLLKLEQNCELNKKMLKLEEERKLTYVQKISDLELKLKEKEVLREKQAAIINSKTVSIKSDESVLKSYQNEIIDIQVEIEFLKELDKRLDVNLRLQCDLIQKLEEFIRVSKNATRMVDKAIMNKLIQTTEILKKFEKDIEKEIDEVQNKLNEHEIASNSLFIKTTAESTKGCHASNSKTTKISCDISNLLKESLEDPENDEETPTSFGKRQKRFETPERCGKWKRAKLLITPTPFRVKQNRFRTPKLD